MLLNIKGADTESTYIKKVYTGNTYSNNTCIGGAFIEVVYVRSGYIGSFGIIE